MYMEDVMGTMVHHAVVVTSWSVDALLAAKDRAEALGFQVLGPSEAVMNSVRTFMVCPDGSKEGWAESDKFDLKRDEFIEYLKRTLDEDDFSPLSWVAVAYSNDYEHAGIVDHSWNRR
jgi:hypothetical protein